MIRGKPSPQNMNTLEYDMIYYEYNMISQTRNLRILFISCGHVFFPNGVKHCPSGVSAPSSRGNHSRPTRGRPFNPLSTL
jgi:hypothetical protein